jgi:Fe-S-cluster containining protein
MALKELYQKVADFENGLSAITRSKMQCQNKCSQCCRVELSVFQVEADLITGWFISLSEEQKTILKTSWLVASEKGVCSFLKNDSCTIYETRPLICRTQGLVFKFIQESKELLDVCPLNEGVLEKIQSKEILNLDLLNLILSRIENEDSNGQVRDRVNLSDLQQKLLHL